MKKVLVAGAALMLAGSMAAAAYAEVNLSGDARVRYVGKWDYGRMLTWDPMTRQFVQEENGYHDNFNSRIRVVFDAKSKGGAYMKARLRFDDIVWDGQGWGAWSEGKNVWADYAYIGVPMGSVDVSGGRMPANFSKFFSWDGRPTRLKADWKGGNVRIIGLIDVIDETGITNQDVWDDNDFMAYGLVASVKMGDDWTVKGYARYHADDRGAGIPNYRDRSGFLGAINAAGKAGPVGIEADLAYKSDDVLGGEDSGWGANILATMDMGAFTPGVILGGTWDGYLADDDFGFIMMGAAEPITVVDQIGNANGDSWWIGLVANYAVSDQFRLAGNAVFANFDNNNVNVDRIADAFELSGSATYTVSEGAEVSYKLGMLAPSYDGRLNSIGISDDAYVGHYLRMLIKF
jgi:hypothetical protein